MVEIITWTTTNGRDHNVDQRFQDQEFWNVNISKMVRDKCSGETFTEADIRHRMAP